MEGKPEFIVDGKIDEIPINEDYPHGEKGEKEEHELKPVEIIDEE